nr:Gag-Pol polyprotein [Tanacetum cinerariifolium]
MASAHNSSDPAPTCQSMASVQNSSDPANTRQTMASAHNSSDPAPTRQSMASAHNSSDPAPTRQSMASAHNSSNPAPTRQSMASVQNSSDPANTRQTMASAHNSSDPTPECQMMALEHSSLSPGRNCQENVSHKDKTDTTSNELDLLFSPMFDELLNGSTKVVSKSSAVSAADALNQQQIIGNPSQSVRTRRQLESDAEMCMFTLTVSRTEPKNIKEAMADSAWIESMQVDNTRLR